jgi:hypothetical protein
MALSWQVTNVYGGDARELWYGLQPVSQDYYSLQRTLEEYSQRDNGTIDEIEVTVQASPDGAIAWALRGFPNAHFVEQLDPFTMTPAVLAPDNPATVLGQEYVGQQFVLNTYWDTDWLNWTDIGSWLFARRTRFAPQEVNPYRLWVSKDLYDVEAVPLPQ